MSSLSLPLQILLDIGIVAIDVVETALATDQTSSSNVSLTSRSVDPSDLTGSLGPGIALGHPPLPITPRKQPPLFWKAIGFCLKKKFTNSSSLYDDGRALFLGEPGQTGVTAGTMCPEEATNYQAFIKGDAMQMLNRPTFSTRGGSYFELLNLYLKYVGQDDASEDLFRARQTLIDSKIKKDQMWENARLAYIEEQQKNSISSDQSFIDYVKGNADYIGAWMDEEKAERSFTQVQTPELASISMRLHMIRLADMRMEPQLHNNMKVIAIDEDWLSHPIQDAVDSKYIFYRPEYVLPDYQTTALNWIKQGISSFTRVGPYEIPLVNIWDRSWSDLGHSLLDSAQPNEKLTPESKDFINSLTATMTFLQPPYAADIHRGVWDINDLRRSFPLKPDAPQMVKNQFCKTTRLILAWGLEIELNIPYSVSTNSIGNVTLASMDLPLQRVGNDGKKMIFSAGDTGFPILLGAIADII